jgi:hypothetical protein
MKRVKWKYPILAFLFVVALLLSVISPFMLKAQPPEMPTPIYMPGERPPELRGKPIFAPGEPRPTSTPNLEEMKLLPKVTPPILPTLEITDLAPGLAHNNKIQIRVTRPDGTARFIFISPNMDLAEVLQAHLKPGEKALIVPSLGGQPSKRVTEEQ